MTRRLAFSLFASLLLTTAAAANEGIRTFSGDLTSYRTCRIQGEDDKHVLAKISTAEGRVVVLDLGPVPNLKQQQCSLSRGQKMQASGRAGRLNDKPIVVVQQFTTNGKEVTVDRQNMRSSREASGPGGQAVDAPQEAAPEATARLTQEPRGRKAHQPHPRPAPGPGAATPPGVPPPSAHAEESKSDRGEKRLDGELVALRTVQLRGESQPHVLGKVRDDKGRIVVVDLGSVEKLRRDQTRPSKGQRIEGTGRSGRLNGRPIVVVTSFNLDADRAHGRRFSDQAEDQRPRPQNRRTPRGVQEETQRPRAAQRGEREGPRESRQYLLRGEVQDIRDVKVKDSSTKHRLIKMKTSEGRSVIVDLGNAKPLEEMKLQKGDEIIVLGERGSLNNRPVMKADAIAELITLERQDSLSKR